MSARQKINSQIVQEAAKWAEELDDGGLPAEKRQTLADWLLKSPDHVNELLMASAIFRAFDDIQHDKDVSLDDLLASTAPEVLPLMRAASPVENVDEDDDGKSAALAGLSHIWRRPSMLAAAAALLGFIAVGAFLLTPERGVVEDAANVFATMTGEQRSVPLDDGSIVHLNTESEVRIRFENGERNIDLIRGEAMFQVAHNPDQPFRVHAGDTVAEAIGTTFNVYRQDDQTTVAVIEGKVAVEPFFGGLIERAVGPANSTNDEGAAPEALEETGTDSRLTLTAGEQVAVRRGGEIETARVANMETVTSWRMRKLVFERETLDAIVREYNRYSKLQIYVDDPALAQTRFTGVFAADDPESLLTFLELAGGIRAVRRSPVEVRLQTTGRRDG